MPAVNLSDVEKIKKKPGVHVLLYLNPNCLNSRNFLNYLLEVAHSKGVECLVCSWNQYIAKYPAYKNQKLFSITLLEKNHPPSIIYDPDHETVVNIFSYVAARTTKKIRLERNYHIFSNRVVKSNYQCLNPFVYEEKGLDLNWNFDHIPHLELKGPDLNSRDYSNRPLEILPLSDCKILHQPAKTGFYNSDNMPIYQKFRKLKRIKEKEWSTRNIYKEIIDSKIDFQKSTSRKTATDRNIVRNWKFNKPSCRFKTQRKSRISAKENGEID